MPDIEDLEKNVFDSFLNVLPIAKTSYDSYFIDLVANEIREFIAEKSNEARSAMVDGILRVMVDCSGDPGFMDSEYADAIFNLVMAYRER